MPCRRLPTANYIIKLVFSLMPCRRLPSAFFCFNMFYFLIWTHDTTKRGIDKRVHYYLNYFSRACCAFIPT